METFKRTPNQAGIPYSLKYLHGEEQNLWQIFILSNLLRIPSGGGGGVHFAFLKCSLFTPESHQSNQMLSPKTQWRTKDIDLDQSRKGNQGEEAP